MPIYLELYGPKAWSINPNPGPDPALRGGLAYPGLNPIPYMPDPGVTPWTLKPDWTDGLTERLMWLTDVLTSRTGVEQRRMLRLSPRRQFDTNFRASRQNRRWLDSVLSGKGAGLFNVPIWWERLNLTAPVEEGDFVLQCDTSHTELRPGDEIMVLGSNPFDYEMGWVLVVELDRLVLNSTMARNWPAGARVYRTVRARINDAPSMNRVADDTFTGMIQFQTLNGADYTASIPAGNPPFMDLRPSYMDDITFDYNRIYAELDNQKGIPHRVDLGGQAFNVYQTDFLLRGKEQHDYFRRMLYYFQGKLKPAMLSTNMNDLVYQGAGVGATDTTMTVFRSGFSEFMGAVTGGRMQIVVFLRTGYYMMRTVTACHLNSDGVTETVSFNAPFDGPFNRSQIKRITYAQVMRQDQDDIEIVHQGDFSGASTCTTTFRTLSSTPRLSPAY